MESQEELWVVSCLQHAPYVKIVAPSDVEIKLNSKELSFFVSKKGCDDMLNIIKEKD